MKHTHAPMPTVDGDETGHLGTYCTTCGKVLTSHKAEPRIRGQHMVCFLCDRLVYQRLTRRVVAGRPTFRREWRHLGYRNTEGLRKSLVERSTFYEGENFGTGRPSR